MAAVTLLRGIPFVSVPGDLDVEAERLGVQNLFVDAFCSVFALGAMRKGDVIDRAATAGEEDHQNEHVHHDGYVPPLTSGCKGAIPTICKESGLWHAV